MKGIISSFRRGMHRQHHNLMVVLVEGIDSAEKASQLKGKEVSFKTAGDREIRGKVTSPHGNRGAVRVLFEKGMPGQALNQQVEIKQ